MGSVCCCLCTSDFPKVVLSNNIITSKIVKPTREGEREKAIERAGGTERERETQSKLPEKSIYKVAFSN